jgi:hypothetical protein
MGSELARFVAAVLDDLDAAGPLADYLAESGREREAVLLRRRWKAWRDDRAHVESLAEHSARPLAITAWVIRHDSMFRNYIRSRFTPKRKYTPPAAHECQRPRTCSCGATADEPGDDCPIHGSGEWPPRCATCGRMMKWNREE